MRNVNIQIRRLSLRANVLPVLTHSDALSTTELRQVREVVRRDLAKVFGHEEGAGFSLFGKTEGEGGEGMRVRHNIPNSLAWLTKAG
jgi:predicted component of type VI protein secretion system